MQVQEEYCLGKVMGCMWEVELIITDISLLEMEMIKQVDLTLFTQRVNQSTSSETTRMLPSSRVEMLRLERPLPLLTSMSLDNFHWLLLERRLRSLINLNHKTS